MLSDTLLRLPQVIKATGRSRASIFRDMREGKFPRSVRIGDRAIAWRASDIQEWIETRPETR